MGMQRKDKKFLSDLLSFSEIPIQKGFDLTTGESNHLQAFWR